MEPHKKSARYQRLLTQITGLLVKSPDQTARMATICAVLSHKMEYFFWCGFYRVDGDRLIVGPYQGPVACQVLQGRGVCLSAVEHKKTILVDDVRNFHGHIACDARSLSEIVVPVYNKNGEITAVLDVDSSHVAAFDEVDAHWLEQIVALLTE
jgi:GAF domain-containing protein